MVRIKIGQAMDARIPESGCRGLCCFMSGLVSLGEIFHTLTHY